MQTADEFIQCYLRDKARLHQSHLQDSSNLLEKYYSDDYMEWFSETRAQMEDETFISIDHSSGTPRAHNDGSIR
jgi:hypothetical protein